MIVDENKIAELVQKEIQVQVSNKLKQIGRDTLKNLYKEAMREEISNFIIMTKDDLVDEIKKEAIFDKDHWKNEVVNNVTDILMCKIKNAFNDEQDYDYDDWDRV